jgi:hypothetical protein
MELFAGSTSYPSDMYDDMRSNTTTIVLIFPVVLPVLSPCQNDMGRLRLTDGGDAFNIKNVKVKVKVKFFLCSN